MRRKHYIEEPDNHDRWLISYADFITLLFAFFVVMYAISSVNKNKYTELTSSLGSAFNQNGELMLNKDSAVGGSTSNGAKPKIFSPLNLTKLKADRHNREKNNMTAIAQALTLSLAPLVDAGKINITVNERGLMINLNDNLLFTPGSAELSENAITPVREIAAQLQPLSNALIVEGHTDNTPISNRDYRSNWELSAIRASRLVTLLSTEGIAEQRLSATGYGASRPIADNINETERAKNRRVAIIVSYKNLP